MKEKMMYEAPEMELVIIQTGNNVLQASPVEKVQSMNGTWDVEE